MEEPRSRGRAQRWFARSAATLGVACLLAGTGHAAVVNGGFEDGLTGWDVSGFLFEGFDYGVGTPSHTGSAAFYGGGILTPGKLSQSVSTVANQRYTLSFWLAGDGYMPNSFTVSANGADLLDLTDAALLNLTYAPYSLDFVASAATTVLEFAFRSDSGLFMLDDVAMQVPEPGSAALLLAGVMAVGAFRRRDREDQLIAKRF